MVCQNCGTENKNTNIRCENCSNQLIDINDTKYQSDLSNISVDDVKKVKKTIGCISDIIFLIIAGPFLLVGLAFTGFGLLSIISDYNQIKGYEKTIAHLIKYDDCNYDEDGSELCTAIYEYEIDEIVYSTSPNSLRNRDGFKEVETVYYNPNNPNESLIHAGWSSLMITGIIILIVIIIIFMSKNNFINKLFKIKDNTKMNILDNHS